MSERTRVAQGQDRTQVLHAGTPLEEAAAAVILVHGRGATAESIMGLARMLDGDGERQIAWLAPQAPGNSWYPLPFMEPLGANEPHRSEALALIDGLVSDIHEGGVSGERVGVIGFSQGACLSLEHSLVGDTMPAFVGALSGGVMGPDAASRTLVGSREGLSVFIGCGDRDGHIPIERAEQSARQFAAAGATVDFRRYDGMDHTINDDEVEALRQALDRLTA
jgi:predicted esterase